MQNELLTILLIVLTTFSTTVAAIWLTRGGLNEEGYRHRRHKENALDVEEESEDILEAAAEQARKKISRAEVEGLDLVTKISTEKGRIEENYRRNLVELLANLQKTLELRATQSDEAYDRFLKTLEENTVAEAKRREEFFNKKTEELLDLKEQSFNHFIDNLQNEVEKLPQTVANLEPILREMSEGITKKSERAETSYQEFLESLEHDIRTDINRKQELIGGKIEAFFTQTETLLNTFTQELQGKTQTQVDKEISRVRRALDEYRRQGMELIDENIIAIIENTLNIALGKKLTFSEQMELVYEALEEAKKENFFGQG